MSSHRRNADVQSSAPIFAALGDETRLHLVARLSTDGPLSITSLAHGTRVTRQAITKHLHVLAHAGVVRGCRRGREQIWELEAEPLQEARRYLDAISRHWDQVLHRLKMIVEDEE